MKSSEQAHSRNIENFSPVYETVRMTVFYFFVFFSFYLLGEIIDQPHHQFIKGHWLIYFFIDSLNTASFFCWIMLILVPVDLIAQHLSDPTLKKDYAYYPQIQRCREWFRFPLARWIIILSFLGVAYYLTDSYVYEYRISHVSSVEAAPKRVFASSLFIWGVLWVVDCFYMRNRNTTIAALLFTLLVMIFVFPIAGRYQFVL